MLAFVLVLAERNLRLNTKEDYPVYFGTVLSFVLFFLSR